MRILKTIALSLATTAVAGADILVTNATTAADTNLVASSAGEPLAAGSGYLAVGAFDVGVAALAAAAATPTAGSYLESHFTAVGAGEMGIASTAGVFEMFVPCLSPGDPLVGQAAYTVIANGSSLATSSAFLIYRHADPFAAATGFGFTEVTLAAGSPGQLVVGNLGTHQAASGPFETGDAYSLAECGSLTVGGLPANAVEPLLPISVALDATPSNNVLYSLQPAPVWLSIDQSGTLTGTPPLDAVGDHTVGVRVERNGEVFQTEFILRVESTFSGWQERHFDLPAEIELAAPEADPDGDGMPNVLEYALRGRGDQSDPHIAPTMSVDEEGHCVIELDVRADDAALSIWFESSTDLSFAPTPSQGGDFGSLFELPFTNVLTPTSTDLGGGMQRLTVRSPQPVGDQSRVFYRAMVDDGHVTIIK